MPKSYPKVQRDRAVHIVLDRLDKHPTLYAACEAIGPKLGIGSESLGGWALQAQIDSGQRTGPTSDELAEINTLKNSEAGISPANSPKTGPVVPWGEWVQPAITLQWNRFSRSCKKRVKQATRGKPRGSASGNRALDRSDLSPAQTQSSPRQTHAHRI